MPKPKQKKSEVKIALIIVSIFIAVCISVLMTLTVKEKIDKHNDKAAMEQTLADVSGLYDKLIMVTPEQEELAYKPENTCAHKSGLWEGYSCQVKGSIKYDNPDGDLNKYFRYIDQIIDLNKFAITEKGSPQNFEGKLHQMYEIRNKKTHIVCKIYGSHSNGKARITLSCPMDSSYQLYGFEDSRKDEGLYSD